MFSELLNFDETNLLQPQAVRYRALCKLNTEGTIYWGGGVLIIYFQAQIFLSSAGASNVVQWALSTEALNGFCSGGTGFSLGAQTEHPDGALVWFSSLPKGKFRDDTFN
jgi:hypothetical protein